jgi:exoribonuclease R
MAIAMAKIITATYSGTVTAITPKTIVISLPTLALEGDVPIRANDSDQNVKM